MPVRVSVNDSVISEPTQESVVSDNSEKIAEAKVHVNWYGKWLRRSSFVLIALGALGVLSSIHSGLNARHIAEKLMHRHPHPHNTTETEDMDD